MRMIPIIMTESIHQHIDYGIIQFIISNEELVDGIIHQPVLI